MSTAITRILVPTDFSAHSDAAIHYAADLATNLGATLELLHVVENPIVSGAWAAEIFAAHAEDILEDVADEARGRMEETAAALAERGIATNVTVLSGPPSAGIAHRAGEGAFDLIVMGTHGRTGLTHAVLGSVAERVLRRAPCAVLTVKADAHAKARSDRHGVEALQLTGAGD